MQNKAFFVSTEYIFENYSGYLDNNIDSNSIVTFIWIAQQEQTQQLLGYTLYQKYITELIADPTLAGASLVNYKYLLLNYLVDSVSLWAIYYSLDTLHLRVTNKSIVKKNSEFSQAVGTAELIRIKSQVQERAQFADSRVREYIINNPSYFPEYYQVSGINRMVPKNNTYFGGIYLGPNMGFGCNHLPGMGIDLPWN